MEGGAERLWERGEGAGQLTKGHTQGGAGWCCTRQVGYKAMESWWPQKTQMSALKALSVPPASHGSQAQAPCAV